MHYVVVGGGVAGVCCAEELCLCCPDDTVTLVSVDKVLKGINTVARITRTIEELQVVEKNLGDMPFPNFRWLQGIATGIDPGQRVLHVTGQDPLPYDKLCICTGSQPRRLLNSPHVLVLRDTDSVAKLAERLQTAARAVVVGNGGIALELAQALKGIDVTWIVRHGHIGDAFFDVDAAQFLLEELQHGRGGDRSTTQAAASAGTASSGTSTHKARPSSATNGGQSPATLGHAVGPKWTAALPERRDLAAGLSIEYAAEVADVRQRDSATGDSHLEVVLTDGRVIPTDVVISVIGVDPGPAVSWVPGSIARGPEGGLAVDRAMQTTAEGVFAAGDACCVCWGPEAPPHWFQMRLWSQARSMGVYAAHCMAGVAQDRGSDMAFEVFSHVTRFLGKKVVLLGLYNGQRLENEPAEDMVSYSRVLEGPKRSFVRVLLLRGRVQGAVMIGETDLEETMENLILDGLDVSRYGPELLDPDAELDHIFD